MTPIRVDPCSLFHAPPHFHAEYGEYEITVEIASGIVEGKFPPRALGAVLDWYNIHQAELAENWELARQQLPLHKIEAVDLSPYNWSAQQRRGKTLAVDDDALSMLPRFRKLRSLDLRDTQVTDRAVRRIAVLKHLKRLNIRGTRITDDGLRELQSALPNCEMTR